MITVAFGAHTAEAYDGPLDLLLALARRNQYPLANLPIAEITRQYNLYLAEANEADVALGGDFIEVASWLVLLKSRAMLPRASGEEEAPADELRRVLLDHESLRAAAGLLRGRMEETGLGPGRQAAYQAEPVRMDEQDIEKPAATAAPTVQDALLAARQAVAVARAHAQGVDAQAGEQYSVEATMGQLEERLQAMDFDRGVSTEAWFRELRVPEARVALLLALLELARLQRVLVAQRRSFGAILLKRTERSVGR